MRDCGEQLRERVVGSMWVRVVRLLLLRAQGWSAADEPRRIALSRVELVMGPFNVRFVCARRQGSRRASC